MRKSQNGRAIAFGLGARGEGLDFSPKVTLFLSPDTSLGPVGVLPSSALPQRGGFDRFLGIYSKIRREKSDFFRI